MPECSLHPYLLFSKKEMSTQLNLCCGGGGSDIKNAIWKVKVLYEFNYNMEFVIYPNIHPILASPLQ